MTPSVVYTPQQRLFRTLAATTFVAMAITGFVAGSAVAREFGGTAANWVLAAVFVVTVSSARRHNLCLRVPRWHFIAFSAFICAVALNIFAVLAAPHLLGNYRSPLLGWSSQAVLLVWMAIAFYIWYALVTGADLVENGETLLLTVLTIVGAVALFFFIDDWIYLASGLRFKIVPIEVIKLLVVRSDARPAGLNSEPSHWGEWVSGMWPFLLLLPGKDLSRSRRIMARTVGTLLVLSGFLSGSRTFAMLFIGEGAVVALFLRRKLPWKRIALALAGLVVVLQVVVFALTFATPTASRWLSAAVDQRKLFLSALDTENNGSSKVRWTNFFLNMDMLADKPVLGVGIAQYGAYYSHYASDISGESNTITNFIEVNSGSRTFSGGQIVKLIGETGLLGFCSFIVMFAGPGFIVLLRTLQRGGADTFTILALILWVNAILNWLQQDLSSYPVAGLQAGLCLYLLAHPRPAPSAQEEPPQAVVCV